MIVFASLSARSSHRGRVVTCCVSRQGKLNNIDCLTPTADLVYGYKAWRGDSRFTGRYQPISEDEYTRRYAALLKARGEQVRAFIDSLDLNKDITICCFCPPQTFCHRRLLARWFKSYRPELVIELN